MIDLLEIAELFFLGLMIISRKEALFNLFSSEFNLLIDKIILHRLFHR